MSLIAGKINFWGVYWGPVSVASEHADAAVSTMETAATAGAAVPEAVRASMPSELAFLGNSAPPSNIGIVGFVFLVFFITCATTVSLEVYMASSRMQELSNCRYR